MRKYLFIITICFSSLLGRSQSYYDVLKELKLPLHNINDKPDQGQIVRNAYGTRTTDEILNNNLFEKGTLYFDEMNELMGLVYNLKKNALKKNQEYLLEILRRNYGKESDMKVVSGPYPSITFEFIKDNSSVNLVIDKLVGDHIRLWPVNNIKLLSSYDEFNKSTKITPINAREYLSSDNGLEYKINFTAFKESKHVAIVIISESKEWKFMKSIQILLDNGTVTKHDLTTKKEVVEGILGVNTFEVGTEVLDQAVVDAMLASKVIKIRINGEKNTGDVTLNENQKESLKLLTETLKNGK